MNIKVISLTSATERRTHIEKLLSNKGLQFEFIDAISGDTVKSDNPKLHQNAVACFLSHRKALEWASVQTGPTLILEDDAFSNADIIHEVEKILKTDLPWDILFLGWHPKSRLDEVNQDFYKCSYFILTHAYLVNPVGAKRILTFLGEPTEHVDIRIAELGRKNIVRVLLSKTKIFHQKGFKTQIPKLKIKARK